MNNEDENLRVLLPDELEDLESNLSDLTRSIESYLDCLQNAETYTAEAFLELPSWISTVERVLQELALLGWSMPAIVYNRLNRQVLEQRTALWSAEERIYLCGTSLSRTPYVITEHAGRALDIKREQVEIMLSQGLSQVVVARLMGISLSTLKRRITSWGIVIHRYTPIEDDALQDLLAELRRTGHGTSGVIAIEGALLARGVRVQRERLRTIVRLFNPEPSLERWLKLIRRRVYSVPFPHSLWHIDGYHKLVRWKIVIHGGIDGKTRLITFMHASTNNRSDTVTQLFLDATSRYGWPSRARGDWGGENEGVKEWMERMRGLNRGSWIAGRSVHNQRIERLWRNLWEWTICTFYYTFRRLEDAGLLRPDSDADLWCLHLIYLPRINAQLQQNFVPSWNNHKVRTARNMTPRQLLFTGLHRAEYMGFDLDPHCKSSLSTLDDAHEAIRDHALVNFAHYGADWRGPQRARHEDDPYVQVPDVAAPPFLGQQAVADCIAFAERHGLVDLSEVAGMELYISLREFVRASSPFEVPEAL